MKIVDVREFLVKLGFFDAIIVVLENGGTHVVSSKDFDRRLPKTSLMCPAVLFSKTSAISINSAWKLNAHMNSAFITDPRGITRQFNYFPWGQFPPQLNYESWESYDVRDQKAIA